MAWMLDVDMDTNEARSGGAIWTEGLVSLRGGSLTGNKATYDGGAVFAEGDLFLTAVAVKGNTAEEGDGGGLRNGNIAFLDRTLFHDNSARNGGAVSTARSAVFLNSTLAGNRATARGGGIHVEGANASARMAQCTVVDNEADQGGGIYNARNAEFERSIVYGNKAQSDDGHEIVSTEEATAKSWGFNIFGDLSGSGLATANKDIEGLDPKLLPLADNGGPTETIAFQPDSPALDRVDVAECKDFMGILLTEDQRGMGRPAGEKCDVGALELQ